ncbi:MAG: hypothetical protein OWV35_08315 [Firmicutes bacterium]|nr:hypothetical protein [Bacillota bacterium]
MEMEGRWPVAVAFVIAGILTAVLALFPPGAAARGGPVPARTTAVTPQAPAGGGSPAPAVGCGG